MFKGRRVVFIIELVMCVMCVFVKVVFCVKVFVVVNVEVEIDVVDEKIWKNLVLNFIFFLGEVVNLFEVKF